MRKVISFAFILFAIAISCSGQEFKFYLDKCFFNVNEFENKLEIYTYIAAEDCSFSYEDSLYKARIKTDISVFGDSNNLVYSDTYELSFGVIDPEYLKGRSDGYMDQYDLVLPIGEYNVNVKLTDLNTMLSMDQSFEFVSNECGEDISLSGLELASGIVVDTINSSYRKDGNLRVIPNPHLTYGRSLPEVFFYYEIYNTFSTTLLAEEMYIISAISDSVVMTLPLRKFDNLGGDIVVNGKIQIDDLKAGSYIFQLNVMDFSKGTHQQREKCFYINEPVNMKPMVKLTDEALDDFYKYSRFLFTNAEMNQWLTLNREGQNIFYQKFWSKRDPDNSTVINEFKEEYEQLIKYGKQKYGERVEDRFFVLLKYGRAAEIEKVYPGVGYALPSASSESADYEQKALEVWTYLSEGGFKFVFADLEGFGDYTLIYSSNGKETNYPNWDRFVNPDVLH